MTDNERTTLTEQDARVVLLIRIYKKTWIRLKSFFQMSASSVN